MERVAGGKSALKHKGRADVRGGPCSRAEMKSKEKFHPELRSRPGGWQGSHCGATRIELGGNVSSRAAGKAVHRGVLLGPSLTESQRGALASAVCRALLATVHWRSWAWEAPALWAWGS